MEIRVSPKALESELNKAGEFSWRLVHMMVDQTTKERMCLLGREKDEA